MLTQSFVDFVAPKFKEKFKKRVVFALQINTVLVTKTMPDRFWQLQYFRVNVKQPEGATLIEHHISDSGMYIRAAIELQLPPFR